MNEGDAADLVQQAIWMVVVGAGPAVGAAMAVGVAIALVQALTQVQEMTLTFVPKMIAVFVAASIAMSFVGSKFMIFTDQLYARIETGSGRMPLQAVDDRGYRARFDVSAAIILQRTFSEARQACARATAPAPRPAL